MSWNPDQYARFKAERKQPFADLVSLIEPRPHMRIVDLGCGTGELTRELHDRLAAAETIGVDSSESMLEKAKAFATATLRFERGDIATFAPAQKLDLIFSNAALHWIPDHASLFRRLEAFLAPDGQIAIQMPANDSHPSHAIAAEVAQELGVAPRHDPMLAAEDYATLMYEIGFRRQHVRMQVYGHELESTRAVIEWVKGTLLTDYERRLGDRYAEFLEEYSKRLLARIGEHSPYFYTYKRILIWAAL